MGSPVHVRLASAGSSAHDLLLELAGTLVDRPSLTHDKAGRPQVPGLAVSVSYSPRRIAVAASYGGPVGIDLEELTPRDFRPLADRWFAQREVAWLAGQPDQLEAFLRLWTAKEAVGKALGLGLRRSGLRREMPLDGGPVDSAPGLAVTHLPCPDGVLALATPATASHQVSPGLDPLCARG
ncbi:4'-phosphopantetheinyl transferase superfamily protein [Kribbella sp. NPDC003557]|uniref:4'-phosphopantetheinyl transferase family protein n=1 Tax=Kribbella sp. NPDC003557 TaxID=3154449 RepID=UPI0033B8E025